MQWFNTLQSEKCYILFNFESFSFKICYIEVLKKRERDKKRKHYLNYRKGQIYVLNWETRVCSRFAVAKYFWYFLCFLDKKFSGLEFLARGENLPCLCQPHTEHSTQCSTQICFLHYSSLTSFLIFSHSLLSFILLTPFLVRALELSGAKRIFSQSASGSPCSPHQRAPISPPYQDWGCTGQFTAAASRVGTSGALSSKLDCP